MEQRPLRLGTPVAVGRDLDGPERVGLGAGLGHRLTNLRPHPPMSGGRRCVGAARSGPPHAERYWEGLTYAPPGCVTPFTLSVYGAYCATSCVPSWYVTIAATTSAEVPIASATAVPSSVPWKVASSGRLKR